MARSQLSEVVAVRFTRKDLRKLDKLAQVTFRGRGDVLRCLVHQAEAAEHPDLIFGGAALAGVMAAEDVAPETANVPA